jgi:predicted dehydrogenase
MSKTPLNGALIGAGNVTPFHLQAWQRISQASIVAIADPDLKKARTRAREFGIDPGRVFASLSDLLQAEEGLEFVDIATPPHAHCELTKLAAAHGLHVLCQKPFAPSLAEARAMIEACQRAGVVLDINENWRWRPWYRAIKQMVSQGEIGRPVYARVFSHGSSWLPGRVRPPDYHHRYFRMKRVIFFEWGIHLVDVLRFLFGEADSVYARMAGLSPELIGEDRAIVTLAFGELTALIDISWSSFAPWGAANRIRHNVEDVRIEGDAGTIALVPDPNKGDLVRLTTAQGEWEQPAYDCEPFEAYLRTYVAAQSHFVECLLSGRTAETVGEDNLKTLAVTLAAYHSAEHNVVVSVQDYKEACTGRDELG